MFTGLVERVGKLVRSEKRGGGGRLVVAAADWATTAAVGESIAVQGVCLTLADLAGGNMFFDVLAETWARTTLGSKRPGEPLNLERALRAGQPMGGHIVTGHVDGVGKVTTLKTSGRDRDLHIACRAELLADMVVKGSVAVDGVSLTLVDVSEAAFVVHLIPHTWEHTSFRALRPGDAVNIETDVLAKHVRRGLRTGQDRDAVSWGSLRRAGFLK